MRLSAHHLRVLQKCASNIARAVLKHLGIWTIGSPASLIITDPRTDQATRCRSNTGTDVVESCNSPNVIRNRGALVEFCGIPAGRDVRARCDFLRGRTLSDSGNSLPACDTVESKCKYCGALVGSTGNLAEAGRPILDRAGTCAHPPLVRSGRYRSASAIARPTFRQESYGPLAEQQAIE